MLDVLVLAVSKQKNLASNFPPSSHCKHGEKKRQGEERQPKGFCL